MPQPMFTIRNPPLKPLFLARATFATTPVPSSTSIAVPHNSDRKSIPILSTLTFQLFS